LPKLQKRETGCWEWPGAIGSGGYGKVCFRVTGKAGKRLIHRVALEVRIGRPLVGKECALHRCDNRICGNPEHIFLGTRADNVADMVSKGRNVTKSGLQNGQSIDPEVVEMIRADHAAGILKQRELAKKYGVSKGTIYNIIHGKHWANKTGSAD
jgi:hypothetical protein